MNFKRQFIPYFFTIIAWFISTTICAQDTIHAKNSSKLESAEIQWVSQWPSQDSKKKANGCQNRVKDLVLGKKNIELIKPFSIFVNEQHNYWILDQGNNAVFEVSKGKEEVPHFITKKNFNLNSLVGICAFGKNKLLITDSYLKKIFVVDPEKKEFTILNDSLKLNQPTGIAYSPITNQIWVIETAAHCVTILNEKGVIVKKIGFRGQAKGEFNFPTHIWIDTTGNAYIVDAMNFRVQIFNKEGEVISVFGKQGDASGYLARPKGIATDSYGNVYIVDALFNVVQIFDVNGNFLFKFGAQGQGQNQFWMPNGIYIDKNDFIYVADSYNSRIQVFQLTNCVKK